jgi:hypothetical protein
MPIVKISHHVWSELWYIQLALVVVVAVYYTHFYRDDVLDLLRFWFTLVLSAHLLLAPIHFALSNGTTIASEVYVGKYHDRNETEHSMTAVTNSSFYFGLLLSKSFDNFDQFIHTRSGIGAQIWYNGDTYQGAWRDNNMNGKGKYRWINGEVYEGDWIDGKRSGHGIQTWPGGEVYQGQWSNHKRNGKGNLTLPNIALYEGEFADDNYHGLGSISFTDGRVFKGEFRNGVFGEHGNVTLPNSTPHVPVRSIMEHVGWLAFVAISYAIIYYARAFCLHIMGVLFHTIFSLFICGFAMTAVHKLTP